MTTQWLFLEYRPLRQRTLDGFSFRPPYSPKRNRPLRHTSPKALSRVPPTFVELNCGFLAFRSDPTRATRLILSRISAPPAERPEAARAGAVSGLGLGEGDVIGAVRRH